MHTHIDMDLYSSSSRTGVLTVDRTMLRLLELSAPGQHRSLALVSSALLVTMIAMVGSTSHSHKRRVYKCRHYI